MRDPRGFAVKLYTEEGVWDLVGNNTPIFFIRDPILVRLWTQCIRFYCNGAITFITTLCDSFILMSGSGC